MPHTHLKVNIIKLVPVILPSYSDSSLSSSLLDSRVNSTIFHTIAPGSSESQLTLTHPHTYRLLTAPCSSLHPHSVGNFHLLPHVLDGYLRKRNSSAREMSMSFFLNGEWGVPEEVEKGILHKKMAWGDHAPGKVLPHEHEDLSLEPQHLYQKPGAVVCVCNLGTKEAETAFSRTSWPVSLATLINFRSTEALCFTRCHS